MMFWGRTEPAPSNVGSATNPMANEPPDAEIQSRMSPCEELLGS